MKTLVPDRLVKTLVLIYNTTLILKNYGKDFVGYLNFSYHFILNLPQLIQK